MDPQISMGRRISRADLPIADARAGGSRNARLCAVLPFSKRPPPPEEYFLRSGDFEAVQPLPSSASHSSQERTRASHTPVSLPAPPPPAFARHAAPSPYGFSHSPPRSYGYNDLSAPPPPHSLTPVAMISERTGQGPASTARRGSTLSLGEKPSLKWGVMIALTGALLGGVLGLGMDARRQREQPAVASASTETAAAAAATALPAQAALNGLSAPVTPPAPPPSAVLAGNGSLPLAARPPAVLAPPAPIVVAPERPERAEKPAKPERQAKVAPPAKRRSFVAAKVPAPKQPPAPAAKAEKPEPAPKPEPVAKPEKAAPKAGSSDARKVLEDAIKDTTNTL